MRRTIGVTLACWFSCFFGCPNRDHIKDVLVERRSHGTGAAMGWGIIYPTITPDRRGLSAEVKSVLKRIGLTSDPD